MDGTREPGAVELLALGRCALRVDGTEARDLVSQPKRFGLLVYLALARPPGLRQRDELLALMWPELPEGRARQALSQALYFIGSHVGADAIERGGKSLIGVGSAVDSDVRRFERAIGDGRLEEALSGYHGDLLPGFHVSGCHDFDAWLEGERRRLRDLAATTAATLSEQCDAAGRSEDAVRWARWVLRRRPYDEAAAARLFGLHAARGDHSAIRREYDVFARRMRTDLELEPGPELRELVTASTPPATVDVSGEGDAVEEETRPTGDPPLPSVPGPPATGWLPRPAAILAGVAAIIVLLLGGRLLSDGSGGTAVASDRALVVVLPFEVLPADSADRPVGRLASDWIARGVAASGIADVIAPSAASASAAGGGAESLTPAQLRESGATHVVSGRLHRSEDRLGLEVTIRHAPSQAVAMTLPVRTVPDDEVTALIEDVGDRTTAALATLLDERLGRWAEVSSRPPSMAAYRMFLDGLDWFAEADADSTDHYLMAAAADDPGFTAPLVWAVRSRVWFHRLEAADSLVRALEARREELAPWDRAMLDYYVAYFRGTWEEAFQAARRVERTAPDPEWSLLVAGAAQAANRPADALAALDRIDRDARWARDWPYSWRVWTIVHHQAGNFEAELAEADRVRSDHPIPARVTALGAYAGMGRVDAVEATLAELSALLPPDESRVGVLRTVAEELRAHGNADAAGDIVDEALRLVESRIESGDTTATMAQLHGELLYLGERWREAHDVLSSLEGNGPGETLLVSRARAAARLGLEEEARAAVARLAVDDPGNKGHDAFRASTILAALGDRAGATRLLRQAIDGGFGYYEFVHRVQDYADLWSYPPFAELMRSTS